jgi:hypothetical protein
MSIYKPTWLYIKQHNQTGLKYFGKTIRKDPRKYLGSGKYWKSHLAIHGSDIDTIWCQLFENKEELMEYAIRFSTENKIVESNEWANLIPEDGISSSGVTGERNGSFGRPAWGCGVKGNVPWNKDKRGVQVAWNKGVYQQPWNKGITLTDEQKKNMGSHGNNKGQTAWNKGKPTIPESTAKRLVTLAKTIAKRKAAKEAALQTSN